MSVSVLESLSAPSTVMNEVPLRLKIDSPGKPLKMKSRARKLPKLEQRRDRNSKTVDVAMVEK